MKKDKIYPTDYSRNEIKEEIEKMLIAIEKQTDHDSIDYLIKYTAKYQAGNYELNQRDSKILNFFIMTISVISLIVAIISYYSSSKSTLDSKNLTEINAEIKLLNQKIELIKINSIESTKNIENFSKSKKEIHPVENSKLTIKKK